MMIKFSQQGNLTSLFPDFCKQPFSVWQQQTRKIKARIPKALTKPVPLAKVNAIQHRFGKASRRGKQLFPGCFGSVQAELTSSIVFSIIQVVFNFVKTEVGDGWEEL